VKMVDYPLYLGKDLFASESDEEDNQNSLNVTQEQEERIHEFPLGIKIKVKEYAFHPLNANFVWGGNQPFAQWIIQNKSIFEGKQIIELGCGTGVLSIFLKIQGFDITSSDYDDETINQNVTQNAILNNIQLTHLPLTWGTELSENFKKFNIVIANDVLLYSKQYDNLIKTLRDILTTSETEERKHCYMCWKRRFKEDKFFFEKLREQNFQYLEVASRIWDIYLPQH